MVQILLVGVMVAKLHDPTPKSLGSAKVLGKASRQNLRIKPIYNAIFFVGYLGVHGRDLIMMWWKKPKRRMHRGSAGNRLPFWYWLLWVLLGLAVCGIWVVSNR